MVKTTEAIQKADLTFESEFDTVFVSKNEPKLIGSNSDWTDGMLSTAKYALGNMLGSIAYMYGDRMIFSGNKVVTQPPTSLFTGIPDRPDHGRGFMWDEGFHNHLISVWNMNLTQEIISSWFATTNQETGWICREQMLGREIRSGAPPTSWPQIDYAANPPSQHMLIDHLLDRFENDEKLREAEFDSFKLFLADIYDNFKLNVEWFLTTQSSQVLEDTFRWQGRTLTYCLPSGMDDYPRAPFLTENEAHIDLQVWMIVSSRALSRVATILGKDSDAIHYQSNVDTFTSVLHDNFWDEDRQMYDDFYINENGDKQFEGHTGYLNFWPLFLDAAPTSDSRFETMVRMLIDPATGLWTDFGIRSLSVNDPYYRLGDNYWTSPIWMNINFLITGAFYKFSQDASIEEGLSVEIQKAYQELRLNLINMITSQYTETGYIWEVYDDQSGQGIDNHPFTGWSALVANLMAEKY